MRRPRNSASIASLIALILGLAGVMLALIWWYGDRRIQAEVAQSWLDSVQAAAAVAAADLDADLQGLAGLADAMADDLSAGRLSLEELPERLQQAAQQHAQLFGIGAMFRPYAAVPGQRLYSRYLVKRPEGGRELVRLEDTYDYSAPDQLWFQRGLQGPSWMEPFYGRASEAMLALYCTPFKLPNGSDEAADGAVCADYSIEDVWRLVGDLDLGHTGYPFLLSREGTYISHPYQHYVRRGMNIRQVAEQSGDAGLNILGEHAATQQAGILRHRSNITGQDSWIVYQPVSGPGWLLGVVSVIDEMPVDRVAHRQRQIGITVVLALSGVCLVIAAVGWRRFSFAALWAGSLTIALIFMLGMFRIWELEHRAAARDPADAVVLRDAAGVESYLRDYQTHAARLDLAPLQQVITGVYVQTINFLSAHELVITGVIWQRYAVPAQDDLPRGIFFPDSVPDHDVIQELFRFRDGDHEVIGWFFKTTQYQAVDYRRFPIDMRTVRVRIWHPQIERNVVLVPDLGAYRFIHPSATPGLEADALMPGWEIQRSFFAYRTHDYRTNFGVPAIALQADFPELSLNITMLRDFTDAFISNQIPLLVAASMLFALLMIDTRRRDRAEVYGFTTGSVVATSAAIFFIILLAHIDIRRQFEPEQIMYLEYFYFIVYFAIVGVMVNAFALASLHRNRFFLYHDNLIPKLLYWPLLFAAFFAVTAYAFY